MESCPALFLWVWTHKQVGLLPVPYPRLHPYVNSLKLSLWSHVWCLIKALFFLLPKSWMILFNSLAGFERAVKGWKRFSLTLKSCFSLPCGHIITISPMSSPYHYHNTYVITISPMSLTCHYHITHVITISPMSLPYHYHITYAWLMLAFAEPAFCHGLHEWTEGAFLQGTFLWRSLRKNYIVAYPRCPHI